MDKKYDNTMLPKGATLQTGRYKIEEYLASGGFGNTYLAINNFDEKVAIKEFFMKDINQRDGDSTKISVGNPNSKPIFEEQKAKFMKEAKRLRGFHSKHIVGVIDLFEENDTMYYVMDYIDGESLRKMIEKRGRLPEEEVRGYLIQILDALEEVHSQRIFHLDLKPANIMIDREGQVHVIDFGASKQQKADGDGATTSSALVHTPGYAPIEQNDRRLDKFGPWTDLYALGATLYNALTGKTPPSSTDIMDEGQAVFQFPETVSKEIRQLIIWMMKYARSERPQSVKDVREYLNTTKKKTKSKQNKQVTNNIDNDDTILNYFIPKQDPKSQIEPQKEEKVKSKKKDADVIRREKVKTKKKTTDDIRREKEKDKKKVRWKIAIFGVAIPLLIFLPYIIRDVNRLGFQDGIILGLEEGAIMNGIYGFFAAIIWFGQND